MQAWPQTAQASFTGDQENTNTLQISTNKTTKKHKGCLTGEESESSSHRWNSLGAKKENKSVAREMGERVIAGAQCWEICDATSWPALPCRQGVLSTCAS